MPSTVKRQSAAVMFTDIAGYTSIMASDEEKALSLLQDKRKILKPLIKQHDGVYVKGTGDGTLSYFDSAYNQVQEKANNLESDVASKFLGYPIAKAIVEEWEKVK